MKGMKGDNRLIKFIKVMNRTFNELEQSSAPKSPFILPLFNLMYQLVSLSKKDNHSLTTVYNL